MPQSHKLIKRKTYKHMELAYLDVCDNMLYRLIELIGEDDVIQAIKPSFLFS